MTSDDPVLELEALLARPDFKLRQLVAFATRMAWENRHYNTIARAAMLEQPTQPTQPTLPFAPPPPSTSAGRTRKWREKRRHTRDNGDSGDASRGDGGDAAARHGDGGDASHGDGGDGSRDTRLELPRDASTAEVVSLAEGEKQGSTPHPQEPLLFPPYSGERTARDGDGGDGGDASHSDSGDDGDGDAVTATVTSEAANDETPVLPFPITPIRREIEEVWENVTAFITDDDDVAWLKAFRGEVSAVKGLEAGDQLGRRLWDLLRDDVSDQPKFLPVHLKLVRHRDQKRLIERSVESVVAALRDVKRQQELQDELTSNVARQAPLFASVRHAIDHRPESPL